MPEDSSMPRVHLHLLVALLLVAAFVVGLHRATVAAPIYPLRIGAVFPLHGQMSPLASDEYRGVSIARDMVNAAGGIAGRHIALVTKELDRPDQSTGVMGSLHKQGVSIVLGAYSSELSIPASA